MKHLELLSAGVLLILLGTVAPTLAQERHEEQAQAPKQEQAKPEKQAKPEQQKQQKQQPQAKSQQKPQKAQQQPAKGRQDQQKAQQPQAKGQQSQQKAQQPQAKGQQKQQKAQQQAKTTGQQQGRPQRTPQAESRQRGEPALRLSARGPGRIPDDRFRSNFGREHEFSIGSPRMVDGYSRFQYGGFWFGFVQPWPNDWYYTDDVYIDYVDGEYFLFDPYYPGVRIAVNVVQ
jgi:hypothetical protein